LKGGAPDYTQVAIRTLQQVHAATHPAALLERGEIASSKADDADAETLFSALEAEAEEEEKE